MQVEPFADFDSLDAVAVLVSKKPRVNALDAAQGGGAALRRGDRPGLDLLAACTSSAACPNLLLVTLVAVALLRGSVFGAVGGFFAGLLVDTATLGTLGLTSLVLTVAGYWIGRYGETTGRDRAHAPFLSVAVVTVLYAVGVLVVHFVLGERAPAGAVLREPLVPAIVAQPDPHGAGLRARRGCCRRSTGASCAAEVQLLG